MKHKKLSRKLSAKDIKTDHKALIANEEMLTHLTNERCFSLKEIKKRKIGWVEHGDNFFFSFPVPDQHGKKYLFKKLKTPPNANKLQVKGFVYPKGSKASLYPLDAYDPKEERIVICAGEPDTIAARSIGLPAMCGTAGENTFKEEWIESLRKGITNKKAFLLMDNDDTGNKANAKICQEISRLCPEWEIHTVRWPEDFQGKDVTDFIRAHKDEEGVADALLDLTERYIPPSNQDQLKESLRRGGDEKTILPLQGIHNGVGHYSIPLIQEGQITLFTVTSKRECFPCTEEEFQKRGLRPVRIPLNDTQPRWEQHQLLDFLDGAEELSLGDVLNLIVGKLKEYVEITDERYYDCIALWILATYFCQVFHSFPYLHIYGIIKSGKTKVLQIGVLLSFNGEMLTNTTVAALVRLIHSNGATCGIDEAEKLENPKDESTGVLQEILRVGYKRGGTMPRCEKDNNGQQQVVRFDTYSPKILAGTEPLDKALASRCIQLLMLRSRNPQIANKEIDFSSPEWSALRGLIYPSALRAFPLISDALNGITIEGLVGREAEIWRPLLVIAKVADVDGKLYEKIHTFALEVQERSRAEEEDGEIPKFIQCLLGLVTEEHLFVTVEDLRTELAHFDDAFLWFRKQEYRQASGRHINKTLKQLALINGHAMLKSIRNKKKRGYELSAAKVVEVAKRYGVGLPTSQESVTSVTEEQEEPP